MSGLSHLFAAVYLTLGIALLIGMWTGVIAVAKAGRSTSWWAMLAGVISASVSITTYGAGFAHIMSRQAKESPAATGMTSSSIAAFAILLTATAAVFIGGVILFHIGSCLHALKSVRVAKRAAELEALCASLVEVAPPLAAEEKLP